MMQDGVMIYTRSDFVKLYPDALVSHSNKLALNKCTDVAWQSDQVIYVPRGIRVTDPIQLKKYINDAQGPFALSLSKGRPVYASTSSARTGYERITIVVGENAQVTVHDMSAHNNSNQVDRLVEVIICDYAQVTFVAYQDRPIAVKEHSALYFYLGNHSTIQYASLLTGSHSSTSRLEVIMEGEHAHADLCGVWLLDGARTIDMTTMQRHLGAHNTSRLRIKSAVRDQARSVYRGTVHIAVDAHGTHAAQENKNILLSEQASAYSIPNLEALNNDVYCAHGAAVGQLDEEQLLYMQARGITYKQAQRMLLQGFLADAIPDYLDNTIRKTYLAHIAQWLDI